MERKSISNSMLFYKIFTIILLFAFPLSLINQTFDWWILVIMAIVFIQFFLFVIYLPAKIEFDNDYMYLQRFNKETTIDLGSIYKIKTTGFRLNRRFMWKIKYQVNGINKAARFYPDYSLTNMNEFIENIKHKNPGLEVIYTSGPLDFDL